MTCIFFQLVRNVVESNKDREAVKIVNTGVKAFCKAENKGALCPFRLSQDGSMVTIPFLKKRIGRNHIYITSAKFLDFMTNSSPSLHAKSVQGDPSGQGLYFVDFDFGSSTMLPTCLTNSARFAVAQAE